MGRTGFGPKDTSVAARMVGEPVRPTSMVMQRMAREAPELIQASIERQTTDVVGCAGVCLVYDVMLAAYQWSAGGGSLDTMVGKLRGILVRDRKIWPREARVVMVLGMDQAPVHDLKLQTQLKRTEVEPYEDDEAASILADHSVRCEWERVRATPGMRIRALEIILRRLHLGCLVDPVPGTIVVVDGLPDYSKIGDNTVLLPPEGPDQRPEWLHAMTCTAPDMAPLELPPRLLRVSYSRRLGEFDARGNVWARWFLEQHYKVILVTNDKDNIFYALMQCMQLNAARPWQLLDFWQFRDQKSLAAAVYAADHAHPSEPRHLYTHSMLDLYGAYRCILKEGMGVPEYQLLMAADCDYITTPPGLDPAYLVDAYLVLPPGDAPRILVTLSDGKNNTGVWRSASFAFDNEDRWVEWLTALYGGSKASKSRKRLAGKVGVMPSRKPMPPLGIAPARVHPPPAEESAPRASCRALLRRMLTVLHLEANPDMPADQMPTFLDHTDGVSRWGWELPVDSDVPVEADRVCIRDSPFDRPPPRKRPRALLEEEEEEEKEKDAPDNLLWGLSGKRPRLD